jgi:hypothetical protein
MRWTEHVACMGEMRNAYKILVRKIEVLWFEDVDWIHVAQDKVHWWNLVIVVMTLQVP